MCMRVCTYPSLGRFLSPGGRPWKESHTKDRRLPSSCDRMMARARIDDPPLSASHHRQGFEVHVSCGS